MDNELRIREIGIGLLEPPWYSQCRRRGWLLTSATVELGLFLLRVLQVLPILLLTQLFSDVFIRQGQVDGFDFDLARSELGAQC